MNPLPSTDEWAVLQRWDRGVRARRRLPRSTTCTRTARWTSSPKLPFDWQRVTEEDKQRMIDSVKADQRRSAMGSYVASMIRWVNQYGKAYPAGFTAPEGYRLQNGLVARLEAAAGGPVPRELHLRVRA